MGEIMICRPITKDEIAIAVPMVRQFFYETGGGEPAAMEFCIKNFEDEKYSAWGAWDGDILAGILGYAIAPPAVVVQFFWVYPEYRGDRMGGMLYRRAIRSLPLDAKKVHIFVSPSREKLYTKIGFEKVWSIMTKEVRHGAS